MTESCSASLHRCYDSRRDKRYILHLTHLHCSANTRLRRHLNFYSVDFKDFNRFNPFATVWWDLFTFLSFDPWRAALRQVASYWSLRAPCWSAGPRASAALHWPSRTIRNTESRLLPFPHPWPVMFIGLPVSRLAPFQVYDVYGQLKKDCYIAIKKSNVSWVTPQLIQRVKSAPVNFSWPRRAVSKQPNSHRLGWICRLDAFLCHDRK